MVIRLQKTIFSCITSVFLCISLCLTAFAGTYTVTQTVSGSFTTPYITATNSYGMSSTGNGFWLSSTVTSVTKIEQSIQLTSISSGSSLNMGIFYSTDGTNFILATTVTCPLNTQVPFTITFSTPQTIKAMYYFANASSWPAYGYSVWQPNFTRTLTDNMAPSISLSSSTSWGRTNTIYAYVSDSESGVSVKKWASGSQNVSWMRSYGTTFTGSSMTVSSNGTYTVYAIDNAGNEAVSTVAVSYVDTTAPSITLYPSSTWGTTNTISAYISDGQSGVSVRKWLYGSWTASYMASYGTAFTGTSITVSQNGTYTIYAADAAGNESVSTAAVSYVSSAITVTHPVAISYAINPNNATPFSAANLSITNQSLIPVSVSVQNLSSTGGGSITLHDVPPTKYSDWSKLTVAQTKSDIALGISVSETSISSSTWSTISQSSPIYAANISSAVLMGVLNPNGAIGNLKLSAYYGLSWDNAYASTHSLTLLFQAV